MSRTAESVGGILQAQVGLILLSELNRPAVLHVVGGVVDGSSGIIHVAGDIGGVGSTSADGSAVDGDAGALVLILNQGGLESVHSIQASLLTGGGASANEVVVAVQQADLLGTASDVNGPVGVVGIALDGAVITQSGQQHLQEGKAGQGVARTEGAVRVTVDDAGLRAVSNVAGEGGAHGHVLEGSGLGAQRLSSGLAQHHASDDLGGSATGQSSLGLETTVGITVDNSHFGHHVDSFFISDIANLVAVVEVLGASADGDQRHGHHQSQNQRKELLHGGFSSF